MEPDREEQVFWLEGWEGNVSITSTHNTLQAKHGLYFRCDLVKAVKRAEEAGFKVVGIGFDGTWNINLITEVKQNEKEISN